MDDRKLTPLEEIWIRAWCAYTTSSNSISKEGAIKWADSCLEAYKTRFPSKQA